MLGVAAPDTVRSHIVKQVHADGQPLPVHASPARWQATASSTQSRCQPSLAQPSPAQHSAAQHTNQGQAGSPLVLPLATSSAGRSLLGCLGASSAGAQAPGPAALPTCLGASAPAPIRYRRKLTLHTHRLHLLWSLRQASSVRTTNMP